MDQEQLSDIYFIATSRVVDVTQALYEKLHTSNGMPEMSEEVVRKTITDTIKEIRSELDLIKTAVAEINEYHSSK